MSNLENMVQKIREFYVRYDETKGACALDFLHLSSDDIAWGSLGGPKDNVQFLSDGVGKEKVKSYLRELFEDWEMIHYTVRDIVASGNKIVTLADVEFKCKATGKHVEMPKADVLKIQNDLVVEFFEFFDTAALHAATIP